MAKQITTGKRDKEKLRQTKRIEKAKKKEVRQSSNSKGGSFDDMIAYVDENGNITSTPPDLSVKKEEIDIDTILTSVPKKSDVEEDRTMKGRVEHFNSSKGYGFIKDTESTEKYFFHISAAPASIAEGDNVTFELERGMRGMSAVKIVKV